MGLVLEALHLRKHTTGRRLICISESMKTLDGFSTSFGSLVGAIELEVQCQRNDDDQSTGDHAGNDSRVIGGFILLTEDSTSNDSANTTSSDQGRGAKCSFPLATDVVCLPGQNTWYVRVAGSGCEEDSEIANSDVLDIAEKGKA